MVWGRNIISPFPCDDRGLFSWEGILAIKVHVAGGEPTRLDHTHLGLGPGGCGQHGKCSSPTFWGRKPPKWGPGKRDPVALVAALCGGVSPLLNCVGVRWGSEQVLVQIPLTPFLLSFCRFS